MTRGNKTWGLEKNERTNVFILFYFFQIFQEIISFPVHFLPLNITIYRIDVCIYTSTPLDIFARKTRLYENVEYIICLVRAHTERRQKKKNAIPAIFFYDIPRSPCITRVFFVIIMMEFRILIRRLVVFGFRFSRVQRRRSV